VGDESGDEFKFHGVLRLELLEVAVGEVLVVSVGFIGEDYVFGEQAVAPRVLGGSGSADGASGLGSIGPVGFELGLGGFVQESVLARRVAREGADDGRVWGMLLRG